MKILFVFVVFLVLVSGCSKLAPELYPATPTPTKAVSSVVIETVETTPTQVPYAAPTIEKITISRYKKPTATATVTGAMAIYDPIVGRWGSDAFEAIFTSSGSGNSNLGSFSWVNDEGRNYTVKLHTGESIAVEYNANDTLTAKGYILERK